jgi:protocatechuate 3,4-dioxygenase beta subunit
MNTEYLFDEHVAEVTSRYSATSNPRLREIMEALTRHLLAFADEVGLRRTEWMAGLDFLTRTGQKSDDLRLETMLLSDLLGLSALIDIIEHGDGDRLPATDPTLLGPFYHPGAPAREYGDSTLEAEDPSERLRVRGGVTSTDGSPLGGAQIEIWQNGHDGWYTIQDLERFPIGHLRGTYRSRADGSFLISCLRPVDYPVPMDGPPGEMLRATGREGMRAAHLHFRVSADGHQTLVTELFDSQSRRLDTDVVFGVRPSLIRTPAPAADGVMETDFDIVLRPVEQTRGRSPRGREGARPC